MKHTFKIMIAIFVAATATIIQGCGVKGDPVPPATPAEIGRGKPLFKTEDDTSPIPRKTPDYEQKDEQESEQK